MDGHESTSLRASLLAGVVANQSSAQRFDFSQRRGCDARATWAGGRSVVETQPTRDRPGLTASIRIHREIQSRVREIRRTVARLLPVQKLRETEIVV